MRFLREMAANVGTAGQFLEFLWRRKLWWLTPMVSVLMLLALLLVFAAATGAGPLIYTLF